MRMSYLCGGNVIPDGMGIPYQMEWECHNYVVWECDTRWNGNVIPMWYGNVIPDGITMSYRCGMKMSYQMEWQCHTYVVWECHTYVVWQCHTRWNGNPMGSYHGEETIPYHVLYYL